MTSDDLRIAAKDTVSGARDTASRAGASASDAGASVADVASNVAGRVDAAARATYDKVQEQRPGDAVDAGKRAYAQGSERIGRQIARQPVEALLLAGAIGYLVGWAANRS